MSTADKPDIAGNWKNLAGAKDWDGLLDPIINNDLRLALINYGERAAATELAMYTKRDEDCYMLSRFSEQHFFDKCGVTKHNLLVPYQYDVKQFIYWRLTEASLDGQSAWCGYVAVSDDASLGKLGLGRRDIVIVWRGTALKSEWKEDELVQPINASDIFGENTLALVHSGFYSLYTAKKEGSKYSSQNARDQVLSVLEELVEQYKDDEMSISVVGHSLGGAIATLNAADIVANGFNKATGKTIPVTAYTFGSPRVGDLFFLSKFNELHDSGLRMLRITNKGDPVPGLPPPILYSHVGVKLALDTEQSEYLKHGAKVHNIDLYLHSCAGSNGVGKPFSLESGLDLDPALLNRTLDALLNEKKYDYNVPDNWWYPAENKDMIQGDDGNYRLKPGVYVP